MGTREGVLRDGLPPLLVTGGHAPGRALAGQQGVGVVAGDPIAGRGAERRGDRDPSRFAIAEARVAAAELCLTYPSRPREEDIYNR